MCKIFDGHGDIWTDVTTRILAHGERDIFRNRHLKKFQEGEVGGGIFVIWIDPPYDRDPAARVKQIVSCIKREMEDSKDILNYVTRFADFAKGTEEGKINVVVGIEGLSGIGEDIDQIDYLYHEVGARHAMLTWNEENALATGWPQDINRGLTETGRAAVKRIQDLGMVMDVSHLNDKSFWDVIDIADGKPVIASHSNVRAICPAMRNATDEMIHAIAQTGGLLGINSMREFIAEEYTEQDVEHLANHVDYIADLVGIDYIGCGFDFDDYLEEGALSAFSENLNYPNGKDIANEAEAKNLIGVLRRRGYSEEDLDKIAYKNYYRVFKEVWK
ncbi:peptidase M19 [Hornefia porci]|uniref:Peptidase M19 n=1 Tax=Hornefia porci TaxID=2652292 RepID=A0A1Q9JIY3_9FIRM|nr:membrane dipeptidase [Hornefia porci]OLR56182.1 peptidase M19 [Hornefia porci]